MEHVYITNTRLYIHIYFFFVAYGDAKLYLGSLLVKSCLRSCQADASKEEALLEISQVLFGDWVSYFCIEIY